tara:strand:- start:33 stop:281 length:249 start_codon:yes stop_codon:yes gene_type:complete
MKGEHPNSRKNLKPFPKGVSGNPSGRPIAFTGIKDELKEVINKQDVFDMATPKMVIVERIICMAKEGDKWALELLERLGCLD